MKHLIHIGLPKTGSTFLQRWFAGHPQIAYQDAGIAGFSNIQQMVRDVASTPTGPLLRVTSSEHLSLGYSRAGLQSDYDDKGTALVESRALICDTLSELFPTAHILLVTRGFRQAILSTYSEYVRGGGEVDLARFVEEWAGDFCNWGGIIKLYQERFGVRLLLLPYELLRDDPEGFLQVLEQRFGLERYLGVNRRVNQSLSPEELYWYPRLSRLIRRLPIGSAPRRVLFRLLLKRMGGRPLRFLVRRMENARRGPVDHLALSDDVLRRRFAGEASLLRHLAHYAPFKQEYYLD